MPIPKSTIKKTLAATNTAIRIFRFDDDDDNKVLGDSADGRRFPFVSCQKVAFVSGGDAVVSEIKYMLISREHGL